MSGGLDGEELLILQFEERWAFRKPARPGAKDIEIRNRFHVDPAHYYQRLDELIDRPEAVALHPLMVRRLQRLRDRQCRVAG